VFGSEPNHKGACAVDLAGSNETAVVAVSTKYLKTSQGGWADEKGACGQCMCVHMRGVDNKYNPGVKFYAAKQHFGLTFLGKVADRCGECEDEHIDVLLDRPLSYAPYDPASPKENANAVYANSLPGPRGFGRPGAMRAGDQSPETVGTWVADWNFVPCEGWSHKRCAGLMKGLGYSGVETPKAAPGVDSQTLKKVKQAIGRRPWAPERPRAQAVPKPGAPLPTVEAHQQCGGRATPACLAVESPRQCEDAQWANCADGHKCVRDTKWWWACVPASK